MSLASTYRTVDRSDLSALPLELSAAVAAELSPGERATWVGQPMPGQLAKGDGPVVLFGMAFAGFTLFGTALASLPMRSGGSGSILFPLVGIPFVLAGVGLISTPFWTRRRARRTAYVITDRRAIVLSCGARGVVDVRSFEPGALLGIKRTQQRNGSGDVVFTHDSTRDGEGGRQDAPVGFLAVRDAKDVEARVRALASSSRA